MAPRETVTAWLQAPLNLSENSRHPFHGTLAGARNALRDRSRTDAVEGGPFDAAGNLLAITRSHIRFAALLTRLDREIEVAQQLSGALTRDV